MAVTTNALHRSMYCRIRIRIHILNMILKMIVTMMACWIQIFQMQFDDDEDDDGNDDDGDAGAVGAPGRKKGDMLYQQDQDKHVLILAYNASALKFKAQRRLAVILRSKNAKVPRRRYERTVVEVEDTYNVKRESINIGTVRRILCKRSIVVSPKGPTSPMAGIDMLLISTVLEMESNREPLSVSEGLELANSLIRDTVYQSDLVKWKQDNLGRSQSFRDPKHTGRLGPNYWSGFPRRHPMLREKKHVKFEQKKDDFVK
jgi:hypothetical protein